MSSRVVSDNYMCVIVMSCARGIGLSTTEVLGKLRFSMLNSRRNGVSNSPWQCTVGHLIDSQTHHLLASRLFRVVD